MKKYILIVLAFVSVVSIPSFANALETIDTVYFFDTYLYSSVLGSSERTQKTTDAGNYPCVSPDKTKIAYRNETR